MFAFPDTEKKLKAKISRYKSSMKKEKKDHGYINDGSGKRYILFSLYFVLKDLKKFEEYVDWYCKEFPDDSDEPIQILCWSLALYRIGKIDEARHMLASLMLHNLYMIPYIIGEELKKYDIWHPSNYQHLDYVYSLYEEVKEEISISELKWIKECHDSPEFLKVKNRYIEIHKKLPLVTEFDERSSLIREANSLLYYGLK